MPAHLLFFILTLLLILSSSCGPLPKEGESGYQLTIQLQTRSSERLGRSNSYNLRKSEFAVLVPAGTTFNETGAGASYTAKVTLGDSSTPSSVSFSGVASGNYDLFLYRYDTELSSFPATATAIDYGISQSSFSIPPSTSPVSVTIQLQKEVAVIDSAIQGLNYTAGGRRGTTDADGLLYYFPRDASVTLSLDNLTLETTTGNQLTSRSAITPYDLFGVTEGVLADNVTIFARLLLTLDNDSNAENGIQLTPGSVPTSLSSLDNFSVDNNTFSSTVSGLSLKSSAVALQHLHESMRRKNLGLTHYSQYPEPGQDYVALDSIVAIAFAEPLRKRTVDNQSLQISPSGSSSVLSGTVHHQANRLWFVPSAGLSPNTNYTVSLADQLRGQSGSAASIGGWNFTTGYHVDNGTADAVRQWLLNSSSVSSGSTGPSLQHKGRYLDNLTNTQLVVLEVGNGGPEFHVADSLEPANTSLGWRSSAFYPVKVPYKLNRANDGSEEVRVWYRDNASDSAPSHQSVNITLDRTPPYGWITLPKKTNQLSLPVLVMAGDQQSKAWRYLITSDNGSGGFTIPEVDLEQWQFFPSTDDNTKATWLTQAQNTDIRFQCFGSELIDNITNGTINHWIPSENDCPEGESLVDQRDGLKTNFPAWDNFSFSWDGRTPPNDNITTLTLWLQDQASNVSWGYPFHIQYDNQTPSPPASFELVNLVTSAGQLQATLKLNTSSSEYPLFFLITDNAAQPDPHDSSWAPIDPGTHSGTGSFAISGSGSSTTLKTWIRDEAGNLKELNPESSFQTAKLVAGETLVGAGSVIHRYSALGVDFGQILTAPGSYVRLLDNQTDQVVPIKQWNKDNATTWRLWLEGPLQPSRAYTLRIDNFTQSGHSYLAQEFSFQTSAEDIDLSEGLVAYYSFDNNTLDQSGNNLDGSKVGAVSFIADRFGQADRSIELSGNSEYITVADDLKLALDNLTISAWINADNVSGLRGIVSKYQDGSGSSPILLRVHDGKLNIDHTVESVNNLSSNQWHHITMTRRGKAASVPFRLYIDGKQVASTGSTGNLSTLDSDNLTIGSDYTLSGENRFFDGKIDEVRIYDRELSQAEIQALYSTADPNPLVFESSTPTNNSSGIAVTDNIIIIFNKPITPNTLQSINFDLRRSDNLSFAGNVYSVSSDNKSVVFDPVDDLSSMDNYTLHLKSGIRDYLGNALTPAQIQFQTQLLGDGSVSSPYLINSEAGLQKMHDNLTGHYLLTNNIALTQHWNPLGWDNTTPTPFSGSFDGDNHTISNLTIDNSSANNIGFFSNLSGNVTQIKFQNILVKGLGDTGALAGEQGTNSSVSQLVLENVTVVGNDIRTGGLIGFAEGIISEVGIKNLSLDAQSLVGGLAGRLDNSTINKSYVLGNISGGDQVGGLVGQVRTYSNISESFSQINFSNSTTNPGGIIGRAIGSNRIENTYSLQKPVADNNSTIYFPKTYYDNSTATTASSIGEGRTTAQLQKTLVDNGTVDGQQTYTGWDFVNVWDAGSACEYPRLRWQNEPLQVSCVLHGGSDNSTAVGRTQSIQIGFNRPIDNTTLTYGPIGTIQLNPYIDSDNISLSYDNNTQILTIQRSFPIDNNSSYTLSFQNIKSADQSTLVPYTHSFTVHQPGLRYVTWVCDEIFSPWNCTQNPTSNISNGVWLEDLSKDWGSGNLHDSARADYVALKLEGYFTMPGNTGQSYLVYFQNNDDDGSILKIGGSILIDDWSGIHGVGAWDSIQVDNTTKTKDLVGGETYFFERLMNERDGGAALNQRWKIVGIHSDYIFMNGQNDFFHYSN